MKADLVPVLRCPVCRSDGSLKLRADASDDVEVREGELRCLACGSTFTVHRGVPDLLGGPARTPPSASGLEAFAELMRFEGKQRDLIRVLPDIPDPYWQVQARSMNQVLSGIPFQPGDTILDIGAATCWTTNRFARQGLRAIALDVATAELRGLYTAEYFLDERDVFFERLRASMEAIPLASESVDFVHCSQVLQYGDPVQLRRTLAEAFRVLRPGGRLIVVNELLRTVRDPEGTSSEAVAELAGDEHAHGALRYRWEATRAGFFTEIMEPHYLPFFGESALTVPAGTPALQGALEGVGYALRSRAAARRAYLAWLDHVWGGVSLNMVATKPYRFVSGEAAGPLSRTTRMLAAGAATQIGRAARRPTALKRLPRTPERAAEAIIAWQAAAADAAAVPASPPGAVTTANGRPAELAPEPLGGPAAPASPDIRRARTLTIALTGNCQAQGLGDAVAALLPHATVNSFHMWGMDGPGANIRLAAAADVIGAADIWVRMPLGINAHLEGVLAPGARVVEVPSLTFPAFHPDVVIATTTAGGLLRGMADYHSAIALWAWRRGLEPGEAAALFTSETMAILGYDRFWPTAVRAMNDDFTAVGLDFGPFWQRLKRVGVFMHTINHPRVTAVALHAKAVVNALGAGPEIYDEPLDGYVTDHLAGVVWPVYPFVADALGVPGSYRWRFGDQYFEDVASWAAATWRRYEGVAPDTVACPRLDDGHYDAVLGPLLPAARARSPVSLA